NLRTGVIVDVRIRWIDDQIPRSGTRETGVTHPGLLSDYFILHPDERGETFVSAACCDGLRSCSAVRPLFEIQPDRVAALRLLARDGNGVAGSDRPGEIPRCEGCNAVNGHLRARRIGRDRRDRRARKECRVEAVTRPDVVLDGIARW